MVIKIVEDEADTGLISKSTEECDPGSKSLNCIVIRVEETAVAGIIEQLGLITGLLT